MNIADQLATALRNLSDAVRFTPNGARTIVALGEASATLAMYDVHPLKGLRLHEPTVEAWCSVDSCSEYWGWEPVNELDERTLATLDPLDYRTIFVVWKPE